VMFHLRAIPSKANFQEDNIVADQKFFNAVMSFKYFADIVSCWQDPSVR